MPDLTQLDRRVALALTEIGQSQQHLTSVLLKRAEQEVGAAVGLAARSLENAASYVKGKSPHALTIYEEKIATKALTLLLEKLPAGHRPEPGLAQSLSKQVIADINTQMLDGSFDNQ